LTYLLTLPPFGFYWFLLSEADDWPSHHTPAPEKLRMLTVGDTFPAFALKAVKGGPAGLNLDTAFTEIASDTDQGKWKLVFFWPKDFTFVCPTEIVAFGKMAGDFADRDTVVYGVSIDSEFVHLNWRLHHDDLRTLPIPMLADVKRELSAAAGVLDKTEGVALRATFLVDPEGIIRYAAVNDLSVGRNPAEVLRVLDALQTDELCPCNWNKGEQVLRPAA
jgi:peroxiredoxin (alkyl hydroperoxide reductase subunit C)